MIIWLKLDWFVAYAIIFNFQINIKSLCLASTVLGYESVNKCLLVVLTTVFEEIESQALSNSLLKLKSLTFIVDNTSILILS